MGVWNKYTYIFFVYEFEYVYGYIFVDTTFNKWTCSLEILHEPASFKGKLLVTT